MVESAPPSVADPRAEGQRKHQPLRLGGGMQGGEDAARANGGGASGRIDLDPVQPVERQHQPPVGLRGAGQPGVPAYRHDRRARLVRKRQNHRDLPGRPRPHHADRRAGIAAGPVGPPFARVRARQNGVGSEGGAESVENIHVKALTRGPPQDKSRAATWRRTTLSGWMESAKARDRGLSMYRFSLKILLVAGGRSELNLRADDPTQVKLVAGARNQLKLLIFAPDFSAWRYAF